MTTANDYAREQAGRFRQELMDFLAIPSISTDADYAAEVRRAADWLAANMREAGITPEIIATDRHPIVYGEWLDAGPDAPTVLIYGHYDVQPAAKADGWDSEPFAPVERDGKIYARGATDDKGQMFTHVKAIESLLKTEGRLPVNVKLVIEGEEESGSGGLTRFVKANADKLAADACLISDTSMAHIEQPVIIYALRGIAGVEIRVSGPKQDLHSGMYGGSVHNPAQALAEIIAQLHHPNGRVAVPGFYDDVRPLSDTERDALARVPWTEADWHSVTGAPQPWGETDYSLRERVGARPTLEVTGIGGGYTGNGFKAIVPAQASAKILCRLVADQDPARIVEAIRAYVLELAPPTVQVEVLGSGGAPAVQVDIDNPAMEAARRAYAQGWGAAPVFMREGGSIPIVGTFQQTLGVPVVMMGFGLNSDNLHGPNEHFAVEMFHRGINTAITFLREIAK